MTAETEGDAGGGAVAVVLLADPVVAAGDLADCFVDPDAEGDVDDGADG